jgi:hypothetical protein
MEEIKDDGTLSSLNIPIDKENKFFNCPEITQQRLLNTSFWIINYINGIKTKFGNDRTLILIKFNLDDTESNSRKFFTNSKEIKYILEKVKEMNKFPRKVTMRASGNRYYIE